MLIERRYRYLFTCHVIDSCESPSVADDGQRPARPGDVRRPFDRHCRRECMLYGEMGGQQEEYNSYQKCYDQIHLGLVPDYLRTTERAILGLLVAYPRELPGTPSEIRSIQSDSAAIISLDVEPTYGRFWY